MELWAELLVEQASIPGGPIRGTRFIDTVRSLTQARQRAEAAGDGCYEVRDDHGTILDRFTISTGGDYGP